MSGGNTFLYKKRLYLYSKGNVEGVNHSPKQGISSTTI